MGVEACKFVFAIPSCELPLHEGANAQGPKRTFWRAFARPRRGEARLLAPRPDQCFTEFPRQSLTECIFWTRPGAVLSINLDRTGFSPSLEDCPGELNSQWPCASAALAARRRACARSRPFGARSARDCFRRSSLHTV